MFLPDVQDEWGIHSRRLGVLDFPSFGCLDGDKLALRNQHAWYGMLFYDIFHFDTHFPLVLKEIKKRDGDCVLYVTLWKRNPSFEVPT